MVLTSCSQMLHQHPMDIGCAFLQQKQGTCHTWMAQEWGCYFIKAPFPFSLPWICPHPFLQGPHAGKRFLPPHWPAARIPACLATEQVQVMTYPYHSFPTQSEEFGCYFPSLDYKAVREACYGNDVGIGSLTSARCQILFKVENWTHFRILASVMLSLPRR